MFKIIGSLTLLVCLLAVYYNEQCVDILMRLFQHENADHTQTQANIFTPSEIAEYNGIIKPRLYLVIMGKVYDVTKGSKHYGPGEEYNAFIGQDASRCFVTGKFNEEDISDHVLDLSPQDLQALKHWAQFYKKEYTKIGKLVGRYYGNDGKLTDYGKQVRKSIQAAENMQEKTELEKRKFPPCNVEWDREKGTKVWCTRKSGGIDRSWIGVPRQLYEPGEGNYRCACIHEGNQALGNIKEYENCAQDSTACYVYE